jgi:hypothetical protein
MTYDASDRKSIRKAEKAARIVDRAREEVITNLMSTTQGRQWLWDLLSSCHVFAQTFTSDPLMTAFGEGRRAIGLELLSDIMSACPDQYITAAREANVRHYSNNRSADAEQPGGEDADRGVEGRIDDDYDIYRDNPGDEARGDIH